MVVGPEKSFWGRFKYTSIAQVQPQVREGSPMAMCFNAMSSPHFPFRILEEQAASRLTGWDLWRAGTQQTLRRLRSKGSAVISNTVMWRSTLRHIEGTEAASIEFQHPYEIRAWGKYSALIF